MVRRAAIGFAAIGFVAVIAAVSGWIPLPDSAILFPDRPLEVITSPLESQHARTVAVSEQSAESARASSTSPAEDAERKRLADVQRQMAEKMYAGAGNQLVGALSAKGLARADGEIIVRRALDGYSSCMLDAFRSVAQERSQSFVVILDAVEATLSDSDGPVIDAVVDVRAASEKALPCMLNVSQQAGIPLL